MNFTSGGSFGYLQVGGYSATGVVGIIYTQRWLLSYIFRLDLQVDVRPPGEEGPVPRLHVDGGGDVPQSCLVVPGLLVTLCSGHHRLATVGLYLQDPAHQSDGLL